MACAPWPRVSVDVLRLESARPADDHYWPMRPSHISVWLAVWADRGGLLGIRAARR